MGNIFSSLELLGIFLIKIIKIHGQVCVKPFEFFFAAFQSFPIFNQPPQCQVKYGSLNKGSLEVVLDAAFLVGCTHQTSLLLPLWSLILSSSLLEFIHISASKETFSCSDSFLSVFLSQDSVPFGSRLLWPRSLLSFCMGLFLAGVRLPLARS